MDIHNILTGRRAISPAAAVADNTPAVSQIIDRSGYEALEFFILLGALADVDATFTVLVEDGSESNLSDAAAVADEFLVGTEAGASFDFADDNLVKKIGYIGAKRYVRLTVTPAGNSGDAFIAAVAVLGHSKKYPAA